jgi:hypothetical protein
VLLQFETVEIRQGYIRKRRPGDGFKTEPSVDFSMISRSFFSASVFFISDFNPRPSNSSLTMPSASPYRRAQSSPHGMVRERSTALPGMSSYDRYEGFRCEVDRPVSLR